MADYIRRTREHGPHWQGLFGKRGVMHKYSGFQAGPTFPTIPTFPFFFLKMPYYPYFLVQKCLK